jgi:hypothetical protein
VAGKIGDDHLSGILITQDLKRHSPILPTEGGCSNRVSRGFARDWPLTSFGTLNFATACGRQNWRTALHTGKDLVVAPLRLPGSSPFAFAQGDFFLSEKIVSVVTSTEHHFYYGRLLRTVRTAMMLIRVWARTSPVKVVLGDGRYPLPVSQPQFRKAIFQWHIPYVLSFRANRNGTLVAKLGLGYVRTFLRAPLLLRTSTSHSAYSNDADSSLGKDLSSKSGARRSSSQGSFSIIPHLDDFCYGTLKSAK